MAQGHGRDYQRRRAQLLGGESGAVRVVRAVDFSFTTSMGGFGAREAGQISHTAKRPNIHFARWVELNWEGMNWSIFNDFCP